MEKQYAIGETLIKALISYLVTRPYSEVAQGISELQKLKPIIDGKDVKIVNDKKDNKL